MSQDHARGLSSQVSIAAAVIDGRYLLKRLRSSGGGTDVYVAAHRLTRRNVALKIPHPENPKGAARVAREIEALARARAPGVIEMLDAGETAAGPYMVMELLEGRTLAGLLVARGKLGAEEVVKIGATLADALGACHESGVVHRDVKPTSVLVSPQSGKEITLLDFGVAKVADVTDDVAAIAPVGSRDYSAPELMLAPDSVDLRADVFGLGATLYECLTGTVPHESALDGDPASAPAPLSVVRSDVSQALREVIERAISFDPAARFSSARELAEAVRACARVPVDSVRVLGQPRPKPESIPSPAEPGAMPATRRKHARAPYSTLARITRQNGERIDGHLEEMSEDGLQFVSARAMAAGEVVRIRFALPASGRVVEMTATSCWTRAGRGGHATGFELGDIGEAARAEIRQYVRIMCGE